MKLLSVLVDFQRAGTDNSIPRFLFQTSLGSGPDAALQLLESSPPDAASFGRKEGATFATKRGLVPDRSGGVGAPAVPRY